MFPQLWFPIFIFGLFSLDVNSPFPNPSSSFSSSHGVAFDPLPFFISRNFSLRASCTHNAFVI